MVIAVTWISYSVYLYRPFNTTLNVSAGVVMLRLVFGNTDLIDVKMTRYLRRIPLKNVVLLATHEIFRDVEFTARALMLVGGLGTE